MTHAHLRRPAIRDRPARTRDDSPVRLTLLGDFHVERYGNPVASGAWQGRKSRALVKLLALDQPHRRGKEEIQDILWPDLDATAGAAAFRKALHYARKALNSEGFHPCLLLSRGVVSLDPSLVWVDVDAFEMAAKAALRSRDHDLITHAASLWTGELLPEDIYEEWSASRRNSLRRLHLQLLREGAVAAEQADKPDLAIELLTSLLEAEQAAEDAHRQLMRLFAMTGQRALALAQYEQCRQILARDLDAEPETETVRLYEEIRTEPHASGDSATQSSDQAGLVLPPPRLPDAVDRTPAEGFVGRSRPLQLLLGAWRSATSALQPRSVAVIGEAGVGKSRLVAEAARQVHAAGGKVLWGAAYEHEGESAYGPFVDALQTYLRSVADSDQIGVSRAYPELGPLLPALGRWRDRSVYEVDRPRLFDTVARLLANIAGSSGKSGDSARLLVVVDDMHNADEATLALFHYLTRLEGEQPWILVCTLREEAPTPSSSSRSLIDSLIRAGRCHEIGLMRLSEAECRMLVRQRFSGEIDDQVAEMVYRHGLGNPLFTEQIIGAMVERGDLVGLDGCWKLSPDLVDRTEYPQSQRLELPPGGIPSQISSIAAARLERLDAMGKLLLETASIIGGRCTFRVLQVAVVNFLGKAVTEPELLDAVDAALGLKLIQESGDAYEFSHPLLAAAVHERLSGSKRAALHKAVGSALETQDPEVVEALAYHFSQAGNPGKEAHYLELAADRATETFANELAISRYREVLRLLDTDPCSAGSRPASIRIKLAHVLIRLGQYEEPVELLVRAVDALHGGGEKDEYLEALAELGRALRGAGRLADAFDLLDRELLGPKGSEPDKGGRPVSLNRFGGEPTRGGALIRLVYAGLLVSLGDYDLAQRWATEAGECARRSGDLDLLAEAELLRSTTVSLLHGIEEGRRVAEAALPMVLAHAGLETLDRALQALSFSHKSLGNLREAYRYTEESLDTARRIGDRGQIAIHTARLGQASLLWGKLEQARALVQEASGFLDQITSVGVTSYVLLCRGQVETLSGDWDAARESLRTVTTLCSDRGGPMDSARMAAYWLAEVDLWEGRPADAIRHLESILPRRADSPEPPPRDVDEHLIMSQLALAYSELARSGSADEALFDVDAVSEACEEHLRAAQAVMYLPSPLRARGIILCNQGRHAEGLEEIAEALALNRRIGYRWGEITDLRALAQVQRLVAEENEAALSLAQCISIALELGAPRLVPHLEQSVGLDRTASPPSKS